jgi:hypothetical protein
VVTAGAYQTDVTGRVQAVPYGRAAIEVLAGQVRALKAGDPLAPVTVVVASNYAAIAARRALAAQPGGIANVTFLTLHRLAEHLSGTRLNKAGRKPVSAPVVAAAVRGALDTDPGVFQAVADHAVADAEARLAEIADAIHGVEEREANIRAGYVYVISNVGAFGERMVKIGMTRRLEPLDRVRELGDASVPFRYDVHALFFSEDAVGIETKLHQGLADKRVNRVNLRREFFYATPKEVEAMLASLDGSLLSFVEQPEADEWHQSENERRLLAPADVAAE